MFDEWRPLKADLSDLKAWTGPRLLLRSLAAFTMWSMAALYFLERRGSISAPSPGFAMLFVPAFLAWLAFWLILWFRLGYGIGFLLFLRPLKGIRYFGWLLFGLPDEPTVHSWANWTASLLGFTAILVTSVFG